VEIEMLPVERLVMNVFNPNEMDERSFNGLVASIEEEGWTNPLQVVPRGEDLYSVVAGHHRLEAAKVLGQPTVPCVLLDPEKFDEDRQKWVMVKDNVLQGKLNPAKFARLYEEMVQKYDAEVLQSLMGFTSEDAFAKVYKGVKDALPKELQDALEDVKDEIRTIDDLSLVLNRLFRDHGETLPSNMMVFSWAGKDVLWIRADADLWRLVKGIADEVTATNGDMTQVMKNRLQAAVPV